MSTKLLEEDILRKKVWKVINLIQANQLFVHSKDLEIKYFDEKSKKVKSKMLPDTIFPRYEVQKIFHWPPFSASIGAR